MDKEDQDAIKLMYFQEVYNMNEIHDAFKGKYKLSEIRTFLLREIKGKN